MAVDRSVRALPIATLAILAFAATAAADDAEFGIGRDGGRPHGS